METKQKCNKTWSRKWRLKYENREHESGSAKTKVRNTPENCLLHRICTKQYRMFSQ